MNNFKDNILEKHCYSCKFLTIPSYYEDVEGLCIKEKYFIENKHTSVCDDWKHYCDKS